MNTATENLTPPPPPPRFSSNLRSLRGQWNSSLSGEASLEGSENIKKISNISLPPVTFIVIHSLA